MILTATSDPLYVELPTRPGASYHLEGLTNTANGWDGATVTPETYVDDEWFPLPAGEQTEDFSLVHDNGEGAKLRLTLADATANTRIALNITERVTE